jgi:hypothetical protein
MRWWWIVSARNPLWRVSGVALMAGIVGITTLFVARGPRPLQPTGDAGAPAGAVAQGRHGTVTEPLGDGLFVLSYETITGMEEDLQLHTVTGRLQDPRTVWKLDAPSARKAGGVWTLFGPMAMSATPPGGGPPLGKGAIAAEGPALGWDKGVWHGLSPMVWEELEGSGRGRWDLPAGWRRGLDGRFVVDRGPVRWTAAQPGALRTLTAQRMWAILGLQDGHLEDVTGELTGGTVTAQVVDLDQAWLRWSAPVSFVREDGWHGTATGGRAPRPPEGGAFEKVELADFKARRAIPEGTESVRSNGARWTPAGLRLEGDVRLEQPLDQGKVLLQAPRVLQRTGPGGDLPADLPVGETWAEGQAVLSWGNRSLTSPRIEGRHRTRSWRIQAPALGRSEWGTFSAGEGRGTPARWMFDGPIQARFGDDARAQADTLVWEDRRITLSGRPVTVNRFRERLTGPRVVRTGDLLEFPAGIAGAVAALDGDINLQADRARAQKDRIDLEGRVECQGQGWNLQADRTSVTLGPGNMVKHVQADGGVFLRGRLGEGRGDSLLLDPNGRTAKWLGRVKASAEVAP